MDITYSKPTHPVYVKRFPKDLRTKLPDNIDKIVAKDLYIGEPARSLVNRSPNVEAVYCHKGNDVAFVVIKSRPKDGFERRVIVVTNSSQNLLERQENRGDFWKRRHDKIIERVKKRQIDSLLDLLREYNDTEGGVYLTHTRLAWYL